MFGGDTSKTNDCRSDITSDNILDKLLSSRSSSWNWI